MQTYSDTARPGGIRNALRRGEAWLDQRGKWAWIALTVLLFAVAWPFALLLLAYMIWERKMFARSCTVHSRNSDHAWGRHAFRTAQMTGNTAFDSYKAEALRRLEEEQEAFEAFLQRLRNSKDKSEFDAFMEDRVRATAAQDAADHDAAPEAGPETAAKTGATDPARPGEY